MPGPQRHRNTRPGPRIAQFLYHTANPQPTPLPYGGPQLTLPLYSPGVYAHDYDHVLRLAAHNEQHTQIRAGVQPNDLYTHSSRVPTMKYPQLPRHYDTYMQQMAQYARLYHATPANMAPFTEISTTGVSIGNDRWQQFLMHEPRFTGLLRDDTTDPPQLSHHDGRSGARGGSSCRSLHPHHHPIVVPPTSNTDSVRRAGSMLSYQAPPACSLAAYRSRRGSRQ